MKKGITQKQWVGLIAYSLIFPISQLIGGWCLTLGIILSIPFLAIGYIFGMLVVSTFGAGDLAYILGVTISIFVQGWGILYIINSWSKNREKNT
ncbi:hypothetical protein [Methylophaga thalassica]|uniref:hypothetical protein n=1 Tax=Methylophaga thalassica TaxID=40223 RepID=UPI002E7AEC23|nr:hypothetical protein [Methylophaga thalassica]WVI85412.1 hypothetical protein VSX76_02075 [Methylophaga thalassica]